MKLKRNSGQTFLRKHRQELNNLKKLKIFHYIIIIHIIIIIIIILLVTYYYYYIKNFKMDMITTLFNNNMYIIII